MELSNVQSLRHLVVGRSVGKELGSLWKEVVLFEFDVPFRCLPLVTM